MALTCKGCGSELYPEKGQKIIVCDNCGYEQTVPNTTDTMEIGEFDAANKLRLDCRFDEALKMYKKLIEKHPNECEGYWCYLLCEFGIEYVPDAYLGKRLPTCHRTLKESIFNHKYYKKLMKIASSEEKKFYEAEAKEIDRLQNEILRLAKNHEEYDIFICYKESDNGHITEDSSRITAFYKQLRDDGFNPFMAKFSLRSAAGSMYEPYIYAALRSCKVMLLISSKLEYINSPWVRNEWSRFLDLSREDFNKTLVPCLIGNLKPEDLPYELSSLQCLNFNAVDFYPSLLISFENKFGSKNLKNNVNSSDNITSMNNNVPKKTEKQVETPKPVKKKVKKKKPVSSKPKKSKFKIFLILLLVACLGGGAYFFVSNPNIFRSGKIVNVTFETLGGSEIEPVVSNKNAPVKRPADPTNNDMIFAGWFTDTIYEDWFDFNTPLTEDITLYAKWVPNGTLLHKVSFDTQGGNLIYDQYIENLDFAFVPRLPEYKKHIFKGWYCDDKFMTPFDFNTEIAKDITLYAKWYLGYSYGSIDSYAPSLENFNQTQPISGVRIDSADAMELYIGLEQNYNNYKEITIPSNIKQFTFDFKSSNYSASKIKLIIQERNEADDLDIVFRNMNVNLDCDEFLTTKSKNNFNINMTLDGDCRFVSKDLNECYSVSNVFTKDSFSIINTPYQTLNIETTTNSNVLFETGNGLDSSNVRNMENIFTTEFSTNRFTGGNSGDAIIAKKANFKLLGSAFSIKTGNGGNGSGYRAGAKPGFGCHGRSATSAGSSGSCINAENTTIYLGPTTAVSFTTGDGGEGGRGEDAGDATMNTPGNGGAGGNGGNSGYVIKSNTITVNYHKDRSDYEISSFSKTGKFGQGGNGGAASHDFWNRYGNNGAKGNNGSVLGISNSEITYLKDDE